MSIQRFMIICLVASIAICGCSSGGFSDRSAEAFVLHRDSRVTFASPRLISEQNVTVYIAECLSRELAEAREAFDYSTTSDSKLAALVRRDEAAQKPVHIIVTVQSLVLIDDDVVPDHNAGLAAASSFTTNSRFVSLEVGFPNDRDSYHGILDLSFGQYIIVDRAGSWIWVRQGREKPVFY